jgi:hypothetical protein
MYKKTLKYNLCLGIITTSLFANEDIVIKPIGNIQFRYDDRAKDYSELGQYFLKTDKIHYNDYIIGGTLGIQSLWANYTLTTIPYAVARLKEKNHNILNNEKSYYDDDLNSFIYLGELNIKRNFLDQEITIGKQTYNTPLVNANYRITKNSYQGIQYKYKKSQLTFQSLYFNKIASSTLSNTIPLNHKYGFLGYGLGYNTSKFVNISKHIINKDLSTNGAIEFFLKYGDKNKYVTFENLYVDNFFNTSNLILAYNIKDIYIKMGAIHQFSIGKNYVEKYIESAEQNKKLKAKHYQAEIKYQKEKFKISYMITSTPSDKNSIYNGTLFSPFSNRMSFLRGLNTSHAIIADTVSQKFSVAKGIILYNVPIELSTAYVKYDIGKENGLSANSLDTTEWYFHIKGYFSKNISAKIQYSSTKNFDILTSSSQNTKVAIEYKF